MQLERLRFTVREAFIWNPKLGFLDKALHENRFKELEQKSTENRGPNGALEPYPSTGDANDPALPFYTSGTPLRAKTAAK